MKLTTTLSKQEVSGAARVFVKEEIYALGCGNDSFRRGQQLVEAVQFNSNTCRWTSKDSFSSAISSTTLTLTPLYPCRSLMLLQWNDEGLFSSILLLKSQKGIISARDRH